MGAFLDAPVTTKETDVGAGNGLTFAVSSMQGWRNTMEDAHCAIVDIKELPGCSFFAVFDGHAGSFVSTRSSRMLLGRILELYAAPTGTVHLGELQKAIQTGFLQFDHEMRSTCTDSSGATAVAAFVTPTHVVVANCGDSRCVFSRGSGEIWGSVDHKPVLEEEQKRIVGAGGFVAMNRVNGSLAVSRALGDYDFKRHPTLAPAQQQVSAEPTVSVLERHDDDDLLILCCDGVWDVMSNEECVEHVRKHSALHDNLQPVAEKLLDDCLEKGSRDNMTACLVSFPSLTRTKSPGADSAAAAAKSPAMTE